MVPTLTALPRLAFGVHPLDGAFLLPTRNDVEQLGMSDVDELGRVLLAPVGADEGEEDLVEPKASTVP